MNGISIHLDQVVDTICKNKIHIALLTEMHQLSIAFENILNLNDYVIYHNPTFQNSWNGTAIVVHKSVLQDSHLQHQIIIKGRINKIKLNILQKTYHLYCVYLSSGWQSEAIRNRQQQIAILENDLSSIPTDEQNLVIGGDFNFTESQLDCTYSFQKRNDWYSFDKLKKSSDVQDIFRVMNPRKQQFTLIKETTASRLDRFYVSYHFERKLVSTSFIPTPFSDHRFSPVLTLRKLPKIRWGKGIWKLNESLLTNDNYIEFETIWKDIQKKKIIYGNVLSWWDDAKKKIKKWFIQKGIKKKKFQTDEAKSLSEELNTIHLKTNWSTEKKKRRVKQITTRLKILLNYKTKGQKIRSKALQFENEEENSTNFYKFESINAINKQITELQVNEQVINGKKQVMHAIHGFWNDLWGRKKNINSDLQDQFLNKYFPTVSPKEEGNFFISSDDIWESLSSQNKKSSPASDGLTPKFYIWAWELIESDLCEVINNCYLYRSMSKSMRTATVTLLPKKGNLKKLENWRPISLLNTDYKILSKIITKRLTDDLENRISKEQKCAIKGRQMSDIHLNLLAALKNSKKFKNTSILTCYDFRKAFDMLDHSLIWKTLVKFNVKPEIIKWIQVMYSDIVSQVQVNGALTEEIMILRGIRQGCPLSMLLFVIAIESLTRSIKTDTQIKSPYQDMPIQQYADDLSTITSDVESQNRAKKKVEYFCTHSGLEINQKKTYILHNNLTHQELRQLEHSNPLSNIKNEVKILGIYFNNSSILSSRNWESRIANMDSIAKIHWKRDVSIFGKTKLINTLILPHINHIARLHLPSKTQIKRINSILFSFLWHPRKIEQCKREKITRLRKFGGLGVPDVKLRSDSIFVSRITKIVGASLDQLTEPWHIDALEQIGSRMLQITPSLYSNSRRNADTPDPYYNALLKIYAAVKTEGFVWKDAKISNIYFHMKNNLVSNFNWSEILLQEDSVKAFFSNTEREIAWRTRNNAYKWRKFINQYDTIYSFIPGFNTIPSQHCLICNSGEDTIDHLLIECQITKQIWINANTTINKFTSRNFILNHNIITSNTPPTDENQEDWLIPIKMVNIIKTNLIYWHQNLNASRMTMENKNSWIETFSKQAEEDLLSFVRYLIRLKGESGTTKYHLKVRTA